MTSNVGASPEIAGDAALQVDPYSVQDMVAAIRELDRNDAKRAEMAARGQARADEFSEEKYQRRLQAAYDLL